MSDDVIEVSLAFTERPVKVKEQSGNIRNLVMREMDGDLRDEYLSNMTKGVKVDTASGTATMKSMKGIHAALLCRCLYEGGELVPATEIHAWPSSVQAKLYAAAQKMNGLGEDAEEEAKND